MSVSLLMAFAIMGFACDHAKDASQTSQTPQTPMRQANAPEAPTQPLNLPPDSGPPPKFDGDRAMQYVREIVKFGPRPLGSANHKKVEEYLDSCLKGDQVEDDEFTADTPEGKFPVHNIVASFRGRKTVSS